MNEPLKFAKIVVLLLLLVVVAALGTVLTTIEVSADVNGGGPVVSPVATLPPVSIYISSSSTGKVDDVPFDNEDILRYDYGTDTWSKFFDGSDCGLKRVDIEGFDFTPPDDEGLSYLVMAFDRPIRIPGLGRVDDSDIVRYLGDCKFEIFFDGSDYGLTRNSENINAIGFMPDGRLVISTNGPTSVRGHATGTFKGRGQDLWIFDFDTELFTFFADGSDVDLIKKTEIIDGIWIDDVPGHDSNIYLGTFVDFTAVGSTSSLSGDTNDIFGCFPLATGDTTDCFFFPFFDNDAARQIKSMDGFYVDFGGLDPVTAATGLQNIVQYQYSTEYEPEEDGYDPGGLDVEIDETEIVEVDVSIYLPLIAR